MIDWLYKRYALTGFIVVYYMTLVGYGTYQVFSGIESVTGAGASAYASLMGLPAAIAGILKWRFKRDNE